MRADVRTKNFVNLSPNGLKEMRWRQRDQQYPGQHVLWTDDKEVELPIRMGTTGASAFAPTTLLEEWTSTLSKYASDPALSVKRDGKWVTISYQQYYDQNILFAKALLKLEIPEFASVVITGFNAPEWLISFHGSVFARCVPVGVYATNNKEVCEYITQHSGSKVVVAETMELAAKYTALLGKGEIERIVIYNDTVTGDTFGGKILHWKDFIQSGRQISLANLTQRQEKIKPGSICGIMYTSGTTGVPKGVLLSHDNFTWTTKATHSRQGTPQLERARFVSYLPLSYAGALFFDTFLTLLQGCHVYFADPSALQGTLVQTLQEVKPHAFFSIPRVWEKIYMRLKKEQSQLGYFSGKMIAWAQSQGEEGSMRQARNEPTSWQFDVAKKLVFSKIKKAFGMQEAVFFGYGGGPMEPKIRKYFNTMNFLLVNGYGMTQTTAPQSTTHLLKFNPKTPQAYLQVGQVVPGGETFIKKANQTDTEGEICMRGRNVCMGYLRDPYLTSQTFDKDGYLHSGDIGRINSEQQLFITGRIKQLIITSGGEKIPPVQIQYEIKRVLPCLSNVMVVGDRKPYLTCLISLLEEPPLSGNIEQNAAEFLASQCCPIKTTKEVNLHPNFRKVIMEGLEKANLKAISKAHTVRHFTLMSQDFSPDNGTLTPSLKLKRKEAVKRYEVEIDKMYSLPKL